jgi:hypothetical protein
VLPAWDGSNTALAGRPAVNPLQFPKPALAEPPAGNTKSFPTALDLPGQPSASIALNGFVGFTSTGLPRTATSPRGGMLAAAAACAARAASAAASSASPCP